MPQETVFLIILILSSLAIFALGFLCAICYLISKDTDYLHSRLHKRGDR